MTWRESLRDIEACLRAQSSKLYHLGFRSAIARNTLANANAVRDWRIYADFAQLLIGIARQLYADDPLALDLDEPSMHSIPPPSIFASRCFLGHRSVHQGRRQTPYTARSARQHPLFHLHQRRQDARRQCSGSLVPEAGDFYVMDRGYLDFERLARLDDAGKLLRHPRQVQPRLAGVAHARSIVRPACICDQTVRLDRVLFAPGLRPPLRRIKFDDPQTGKRLVFLTNNFALDALTIAKLYKCRWQVELFFKWIKQHLRIKAFFGTSENAVKTQIWIAVSVYVLVAIVKKRLALPASLYEILQILSLTLFEKTPVNGLFDDNASQKIPAADANQLNLFS